jgi:excisionase family DNA binding protein
MDIREVAHFMRMSESTVRRYIRQGRIPAYKIGKGQTSPLRIRKTELMNSLQRHKINNSP